MKHLISSILPVVVFGLAASGASAAVVQTFGPGSAVTTVGATAGFEPDTGLARTYVENGISFTFVGIGNNAGCGYAGQLCDLDPAVDYGPGFSGNYLATSGKPSYISIGKADHSDFRSIEFTAGTGYAKLYGYWQAYNDGVLTGAGAFTSPTISTVLGLADTNGFDEVRYFAFSAASGTVTGFSAPAIDDVRVGAVSEPPTLALFAGLLLGMTTLRQRRSRRQRQCDL